MKEVTQYQIEPIKESKRGWDYVKDPKLIINLILVKLKQRNLFLKNSVPPAAFTPVEERNGGILFYFNPSLQLEQPVVLYLDIKRHLEFNFDIEEQISPGKAILKPTIAKVSKTQRQYRRIPVMEDEVVAMNFRLSKNKISTNNIQFQITSKIIFPQMEKKYESSYPGIRIVLANADQVPSEIKDKNLIKPTIISHQKKFLLVFPLLTFQNNKIAPLVYIMIPLESKPDEDELKELLLEVEKIVEETHEKIIEANTVLIEDKQRIINISEGGVALEITNESLKELIPFQDVITFDLRFRLVAPIRMYGTIKYIHKLKSDEMESLLVGIEFTGEGYTGFRKKNKELLKNLISKLSQYNQYKEQ